MTGSGPGGPGESINWEEEAERLASRALAAGDATGWFEQLYAAGAGGRVPMPWSRRDAHPLFVDWAQRRAVRGEGRHAVVVGCGLGADAEYTARLGFDTTGFDISATAIRLAGQRFPHTMVHYQVADLLALPAGWRRAFGLVVEIITVQALPDPPRRQAIENIAGLVAPEGEFATDVFWHDGVVDILRAPRVRTGNTHGTGCTLSAALTAQLAWGTPLREALVRAKDYINRALRGSAEWRLGAGRGPLSWNTE